MPTNAGFEKKSLFRAVPGLFSRRRLFNPATPFDNASIAQQTLTSILDSLGGILWLPNQHNYVLTTDTAVAPVGDPVGYIGSHRQNLPENYIKNSMMVGTGGSQGSPTKWSHTTEVSNGVSLAFIGTGTDSDGTYAEYACSGTDAGGATSYPAITPNGNFSDGNNPTALAAQLWTSSVKIKGVSGIQRPLTVQVRELDAAGVLVSDQTNTFTPTNNVLTSHAAIKTLSGATTAFVNFRVQFSVAAGSGSWNNVFRIYAPQLERGKPTAFTPTHGEAITRGANFAPAWQDTTPNKPLLGIDADGKPALIFNGINNFLRTGIQTPEAGYVAGVWKLADPVPTARGLFSSSGAVTVGARFGQVSTTGEFRQGRHDGTSISNSTSTIIGSSKCILDGHYSLIDSAVRKNGSNEGVSGTTRNAATTQYFRIGADGTGTDTQANYVNGTMLAQIWIPGARPGATIEAEIRRLLAEITAVSGVV